MSRGLQRQFAPWWLASLALTLGSVETARATRGPDVPEPGAEPARVAIATPPKPEGAPPPSAGSGADGDISAVRCDQLAGPARDVCLAALARRRAERDPDGGLDACEQIVESELADECRADVAEAHAPIDRERANGICGAIALPRWRDQCVFGIAMAFATTEPDYALQTCERSGRWRPFCRHDVNGERSVVDLEGAIAYCGALPPERRDTCWHGIGKYVARVDLDRAARACAAAPSTGDLRGQCAHGAGWAAAERLGQGALPWCDMGAVHRDSCVMGVAYHAARYDPERAVALCGEVADAGERAHCLRFGVWRPPFPPAPRR